MFKIGEEIISFGEAGSRKSQAAALGATALLAGPAAGFEQWQCLGVAAVFCVFIIGRAIHDYALAGRG